MKYQVILKDEETGEVIYETSTSKVIDRHRRDWPEEGFDPEVRLENLLQEVGSVARIRYEFESELVEKGIL